MLTNIAYKCQKGDKIMKTTVKLDMIYKQSCRYRHEISFSATLLINAEYSEKYVLSMKIALSVEFSPSVTSGAVAIALK